MKGKKIVKKIEITNYRGLKKVAFAAKPINIIVGPNNTGKSSILEAIALLLSCRNGFRDPLFENGLWFGETGVYYFEDLIDFFLNYRGYSPQYLIRTGFSSSIIKGTIGRTNFTLEINYKKLLENIEKISSQFLIKKYDEINKIYKLLHEVREILHIEKYPKFDREKILQELIKQPQLLFILYKNRELQSIYVHFETKNELLSSVISDGVERIYQKKYMRRIPLILNFSKFAFASKLEWLHDAVVKIGKMPKIISVLKNRIPYINDIRKAEREKLYIYLSIEEKPLPLSCMGDGFIALLKLIFLIALGENGVIIFEEPEISLHPAFLDILGEEIMNNYDKAQFFITTHNIDLLFSILNEADRRNLLEMINVIRMHRKGADILAEMMDGKEAQTKIEEIGLDLRRT